MKSLRTSSLLATAFVLLLAVSSASAKPGWLTNFEQAQVEAKKNNKMVLLDFTGSDWCGYCIALDREVFSKQSFKDYARKNLVLVEVDFPRGKRLSQTQQRQNEELADKYGIEGYPTLVILDSNGKGLAKLGYMPGGPDVFIAALEEIRTASGSAAPRTP